METYPIVPEGLEQDLTSDYEFVIRYDGKCGQRKELLSTAMDSNRRVRIVLRPFVEVVDTAQDGDPAIAATIPLESLVSIGVGNLDFRQGYDTEGVEISDDVVIPVSRWVRHPDKGLLRFAAE